MRICSHKETIKDRLKDVIETRKINVSLIKHYTHVLNHFDEIIAVHDADIAIIDAKKEEVLKQFIAAPEKLIALAAHLEVLRTKTNEIKSGAGKAKQVKNLRQRLADLEAECKADGIDIDELLKQETI